MLRDVPLETRLIKVDFLVLNQLFNPCRYPTSVLTSRLARLASTNVCMACNLSELKLGLYLEGSL